MKVKELIKELEKLDQEQNIFISVYDSYEGDTYEEINDIYENNNGAYYL